MLTFDAAIGLLQNADAVIIYYYTGRSYYEVADFVGYDNEGDEDSTFSVTGDRSGILTLYPTKTYAWDHGGIAVEPGVVLIPVKYMKP